MSVTKYRMWDGNKMFQNQEIKHYELGVLQGTSYEMMPFIGLKDKNGKEIYDQDIVKIDQGYYDYDQKSTYHIIEWGIDHSYPAYDLVPNLPNVEANNLSYLLNDVEPCIEVVGNIYENKKLLQEIK